MPSHIDYLFCEEKKIQRITIKNERIFNSISSQYHFLLSIQDSKTLLVLLFLRGTGKVLFLQINLAIFKNIRDNKIILN